MIVYEINEATFNHMSVLKDFAGKIGVYASVYETRDGEFVIVPRPVIRRKTYIPVTKMSFDDIRRHYGRKFLTLDKLSSFGFTLLDVTNVVNIFSLKSKIEALGVDYELYTRDAHQIVNGSVKGIIINFIPTPDENTSVV